MTKLVPFVKFPVCFPFSICLARADFNLNIFCES